MRRAHLLGLGFMAPALFIIVFLFLAPVALTMMFSFTSMSSGTGISSGGAYEVTERTIRMLKDQGFPEATADRLAEDTYKIDAAGIAAVEAEYGKAFAHEIEASLSGKSFAAGVTWSAKLKRLKERPCSTRDLKKAADLFKRSILNTRFETEEAFMTGIGELGLGLPESETDQLARTAYTGWVWTTETTA